MFCPGCGTENPAQALYCYKCGSQMPQATPGAQGFVAAGPIQTAAGGLQPGYLWGQIHGWAMLIASPLLFLLFVVVLLTPTNDRETREGAIIFLVLLALGTVTGFGLVRRLRLGLRLVYVWAGLHVAFILVGLLAMVGAPGDPGVHLVVLLILVGSVFWFLCAFYYHRRRGLFH